MEQSETFNRVERPSFGRTSPSKRAYNLLANILSKPVSATKSPPLPTSAVPSKPLSAQVPGPLVSGVNEAQKKKNVEHLSPRAMDLSMDRSSGTSPNTMGPAPKTISIMSALNEMANSPLSRQEPTPPAMISRPRRSVDQPLKPNPALIAMLQKAAQDFENFRAQNPHIADIKVRLPSTRPPPVPPGARPVRQPPVVQGPPPIPSAPVPPVPIERRQLPLPSLPRRYVKRFDKESGHMSDSGLCRSKVTERTPDWISNIFSLTKRGKLDQLQQSFNSIDSMDPTLIRHLVDDKGNTLLHTAAHNGHVETLQWLVSALGSQAESVLNEKNRAGRNVVLTALKGRQFQCFQWLVLETNLGDKILCTREGERCLLHFAAQYRNDTALRWLSDLLKSRGISIDARDNRGLTPLHMAAKSGSISCCHELILSGANPLAQTDLGWRPSDLALRHRRVECANYLMMSEVAGTMSNDLGGMFEDLKAIHQDHEVLRHHFREILRVAKVLVKERIDLIKSYAGSGSKEEAATLLLGGETGGRFAGMEHKLLKAEQAWKTLEQNSAERMATTPGNIPAPEGYTGSPAASIVSFPMAPQQSVGSKAGGLNPTVTTPPSSLSPTSLSIDINGGGGASTSPELLQKRLALLRSRTSKGSAEAEGVLSASSSDFDQSDSESNSSDEDAKMKRQFLPRSHYKPAHYASRFSLHGERSKTSLGLPDSNGMRRQSSAPWLLPSTDSILSALAAPINKSGSSKSTTALHLQVAQAPGPADLKMHSVDLLQNDLFGPSQQNRGDKFIANVMTGGGSLDEMSKTTQVNGESFTADAPAVLEVIEPQKQEEQAEEESQPKHNFLTPDLIRGTRHGNGPMFVKPPLESLSPESQPEEVSLEKIYDEIIPKSMNSGESLRQYSPAEYQKQANLHVKSYGPSSSTSSRVGKLWPPSGASSQSVNGETAGNRSSSSSSSRYEIIVSAPMPVPGVSTEPLYGPSKSASRLAGSQSLISRGSPNGLKIIQTAEKSIQLPCVASAAAAAAAAAESKAKTSPFTHSISSPQERDFSYNNSIRLEAFDEESGRKSSRSSSSKRKTEEYGDNNKENCGESHVPCANTQVVAMMMTGSRRSESHSSTLKTYELKKSAWDTGESLSSETLLESRLSPTASSEASRTESAMILSTPSHASQNSQLSKTESATCFYLPESSVDNDNEMAVAEGAPLPPPPEHIVEKDEASNQDEQQETQEKPLEQHKTNDDDQAGALRGALPLFNTFKPGVIMAPKDNSGFRPGRQNLAPNTPIPTDLYRPTPGAFPKPSILRARPSSSNPRHRMNKSSRGPPKPWYEIEGSDEEGSHLFNVSTPNKYRSSCLPPNTEAFPPSQPGNTENSENSVRPGPIEEETLPPPVPVTTESNNNNNTFEREEECESPEFL